MSGEGNEEVSVTRSQALPFVQLSTEVIRDPSLSPNARALYAIIATFADLSTRSYMLYRSDLAGLMGKSMDTVDRAVRELEAAGILTVEQQRTPGRVLTASLYTLHDVGRGVPVRGSRKGAGTRKDAGRGVAAPVRRGSRTRAEGVAAPVRQYEQESLQEPEQEPFASSADAATASSDDDRHDTATDTTASGAPDGTTAPAPDGDKRGTRCRQDYVPPKAIRDEMRAQFPRLDFRMEHESFIDYWLSQPGARGVKISWDRTWRNWMRTAGRRQAGYGKPQGSSKPVIDQWRSM